MTLFVAGATSQLGIESAANGAIIGSVAALAYSLGVTTGRPDAYAKGREEGYATGFPDAVRAPRTPGGSGL